MDTLNKIYGLDYGCLRREHRRKCVNLKRSNKGWRKLHIEGRHIFTHTRFMMMIKSRIMRLQDM